MTTDHGPHSSSPLDLLLTAADSRPTSIALVTPDGRGVDYRSVKETVDAAAEALFACGVRPGDRVVTRLINDLPAVAAIFAAWQIGAVAVPLPPTITAAQLRDVAVDCGASVVIVESLPAKFDADGVAVSTWDDLHAVARHEHASCTPTSGADTALLMYTSGSTSKPKGVVCPASAVVFAVESIGERLGYVDTDVVMLMSPLSFDYGLYQMFLSFAAGATVVLADASDALHLARKIRAQPVTIMPVVPAVAGMLHTLLTRGGGVDTVRMVTSTGADLPASRITELRSVFPHAAIVAMYGITECKRVTIAEPDIDLSRPGSVGLPIPGTRISIVDDAGHEVPAGTDGQIVAIGPHVMDGYWGSPDLTAERFSTDPVTAERSLFTGDYGRVDADGHLYFTGRRDDIFKSNGVRTSVAEIAAATESLDIVGSVIVVKPTATDGLAIVVTATATAPEVLSALTTVLEPAKIPSRCVVLDRLPLTANGKVDARRAALALTKDLP